MRLKLITTLGILLMLTQFVSAQVSPADFETGVSVIPDFTTSVAHDLGVNNNNLQIAESTHFLDMITAPVYYPAVATDTRTWLDVLTANAGNVLIGSLVGQAQLAYNTTYYWRVANNIGVLEPVLPPNTGWHYTFTTGLLSPSLSAPVNGLTGVSVEPTLTWNAVTNATSYKLYLDDADDFLTPLYEVDQGTNLTKTFDETIADFPLSNNTTYYWKVTAIDQHANEYDSDIWHFTTVPNVNVYQTFPSNGGLVYGTTAELYWYTGQAAGTMQYKVQLIKDESLASPGSAPTAAEWAGASSSTVSDLDVSFTVISGKKYWWRVIVLNSNDEVISYSSALYFNVNGGIDITLYQSWPIGNPTVYTNTPTCYWYADQYTTGTTYTVWYNTAGDDESGALGVADGHIDTDDTGAASASAGSDLNKELPALAPGTKYYWSVEAIYNGESVFSGIQSFTTNGAGTLSKPILTYPIGGVIVYTTSPDVYWYPGGSADGLTFKVYYRDKAVGGAYTEATGGVATSDFNYQINGLTAGNTYEWYVQAVSVAGTMDSDVSEFTVNAGLTNGYPVATWPLGNPTEYTRRPTLYWYLEGASQGLTKFTVKWYKGTSAPADWTTVTGSSADAGTADITTLTTTNYEIPVDLSYGEKYYWAVASYNGSSYSAWSEGAFTIYGSSVVAPTLTSPHNSATIMDRSPTLYWVINGSTIGLTSYTLVYSTSDVFANGATTTVSGITDNYYALSALTPGATYHWKVTAVYAQGDETSSTWTFTVDPGALSVQPMVGGPNNVDVSTTSPMLSWVVPVSSQSVLSFQLEVADNEEFNNAMIYEGVSSPYQVVNGLQEGMEYFWRVKSSTSSGDNSNYSGTGSFKVIGSSITGTENEEIIPTEFMVMQNYPNPFNPTTTINYSLPEASFVSIKVYDMLGREVKSLVNNDMVAGVHTINWNGEDNFSSKVSSGTYIYRVVAGSNVAVMKMILLK